jgi:hypothetical protein
MVSYLRIFIRIDDEKYPEFKDRESAESFRKLIFEFADAGIELGERTMWALYNG